MRSVLLVMVSALFLVSACADEGSSAAKASAADAKPASAPTPSATPAPSATPSKPGKAEFDTAHRTIFQDGATDVPMAEKVEKFVQTIGTPARTQDGSNFWFVGDGDDCFEVELTDEGSMSASKIFDAELAAASCP